MQHIPQCNRECSALSVALRFGHIKACSFHYLRVKDVSELHSELRQQTACNASAVVHDLRDNIQSRVGASAYKH